MAKIFQSLAELTARAEQARRTAQEIVAKNRLAMEQSRRLLERSQFLMDLDQPPRAPPGRSA